MQLVNCSQVILVEETTSCTMQLMQNISSSLEKKEAPGPWLLFELIFVFLFFKDLKILVFCLLFVILERNSLNNFIQIIFNYLEIICFHNHF